MPQTTIRVSTAADGTQGNGTSFIYSSGHRSISADGRFITFYSNSRRARRVYSRVICLRQFITKSVLSSGRALM